ncbi:Hypothetical protein KLENKIAIHU_3814, partial [Klenkia terrae]|jgi:hypothetical protein
VTASPQETVSATGTGRWYLWVAGLSVGFLACVPFWHAAQQLHGPDVRRWAVAFTAVTAWLVVLLVLTPDRNPDGTTPDSVFSTLGGFSALAAAVVSVVKLNGLRREVYGGVVPTARPLHTDPAIASILAARTRRAETRELIARDRSMARELGIGRPDLGRGYDDGGLVDLNGAPASAIASVCDIAPGLADAVVAARSARGGSYFTVDELFLDVHLPTEAEEKLRERAFV